MPSEAPGECLCNKCSRTATYYEALNTFLLDTCYCHLLQMSASARENTLPLPPSAHSPFYLLISMGWSQITKFTRSGLKGGVDQSPFLCFLFPCWNQPPRAHLTGKHLHERVPNYPWLNANFSFSQHPKCPCYDTCDKPPCQMWASLPHLTSCLI